MKLKPLFDKIVLKQVEAEEKTSSGIVLPSAAKEKPQIGEVIAVGPGGLVDGKEVKMQVKTGDTVLYSKYAGSEFKIDDETVTIIKQSDVLAIVTN
ncbi:MAG: co-chaperone GroES [Bacillota bacterium]|jgi:chaperonin GroES|nr:co-chaperone GroES [Bacillota bacterium]HHU43790.1 co-chaperone GroES [Clostridiales bacterium]